MSTETLVRSDEKLPPQAIECDHCGAPAMDSSYHDEAGHSFCCGGCRSAYGIIHACGLDDYYRLRQSFGVEGSPAVGERVGFESSIIRRFVNFTSARFQGAAGRVLFARRPLCRLRLVDRTASQHGAWGDRRASSAFSIDSGVDLAAGSDTAFGDRANAGPAWLHASRRIAGDLEEGSRSVIAPRAWLAGGCRRVRWEQHAAGAGALPRANSAVWRPSTRTCFAGLARWLIDFACGAGPGLLPGSDRRDSIENAALGHSLGTRFGGGGDWRGRPCDRGAGGDLLRFTVGAGVSSSSGSIHPSAGQRLSAESVSLLRLLTPRRAHRVVGGQVETVPMEAIREGDGLEVRVGEMIPADGVVTSGASSVDESLLTGEALPREVVAGSEVTAGSTNLSAVLRIKVSAAGQQTRMGKLALVVEGASRERAKVLDLAHRWSGYFVVVVLGLAVLTGAPLDPGFGCRRF